MQTKVTSPADKYGPTPLYGACEAAGCRTGARSSCAECEGHYCLSHADHPHDFETTAVEPRDQANSSGKTSGSKASAGKASASKTTSSKTSASKTSSSKTSASKTSGGKNSGGK